MDGVDDGEAPVEAAQHAHLHVLDAVDCICVVAALVELGQGGDDVLGLLVLGCDEDARHRNQLQLVLGHVHRAQQAVQVAHRTVDCQRRQLVLLADLTATSTNIKTSKHKNKGEIRMRLSFRAHLSVPRAVQLKLLYERAAASVRA